MTSHTTAHAMSADALYAIPDDDRRYELVAGSLRASEPTGWTHGLLQAELLARLGAIVREARLGRVVAEVGFVLRRDPDTVRAPDVAFLRADRAPGAAAAHRFVEGPPDLVVEILSPDDHAAEVSEKVAEYLAAGTRLVWVVDPAGREVDVHAPGEPPRTLGLADALDGRDVVPGFRLALDDLFAGA